MTFFISCEEPSLDIHFQQLTVLIITPSPSPPPQLLFLQLPRDVLRNFAKFTEKYLCQSLLFIKKETPTHKCFPVNFLKFLITAFFKNTSSGCFWIYIQSSGQWSAFHHSRKFNNLLKQHGNNRSGNLSLTLFAILVANISVSKTIASFRPVFKT